MNSITNATLSRRSLTREGEKHYTKSISLLLLLVPPANGARGREHLAPLGASGLQDLASIRGGDARAEAALAPATTTNAPRWRRCPVPRRDTDAVGATATPRTAPRAAKDFAAESFVDVGSAAATADMENADMISVRLDRVRVRVCRTNDARARRGFLSLARVQSRLHPSPRGGHPTGTLSRVRTHRFHPDTLYMYASVIHNTPRENT